MCIKSIKVRCRMCCRTMYSYYLKNKKIVTARYVIPAAANALSIYRGIINVSSFSKIVSMKQKYHSVNIEFSRWCNFVLLLLWIRQVFWDTSLILRLLKWRYFIIFKIPWSRIFEEKFYVFSDKLAVYVK